VWDDLEANEKIKVYDKGIDVSQVNTDVELRRRTLISYRTGDMFSPRLDGTEALSAAAREFVSSIKEGRAPQTDGKAGLTVVRCLAAAQKSIEAGGKWMAV
jgi:predicted dehydrogenase